MQTLRQRLTALGVTGVILGAAAFLGPVESGRNGPQLEPYRDIGGVPTWCYGETLGVPKPSYSLAECDAALAAGVARHWAGIAPYVPEEAPMSLKIGMLSVAYNTGVAGWMWEGKPRRPSRFRVALAQGDWRGACAAITAPWRGKAGVAKGYKATVQGRPSKGLENRRAQEEALCLRDIRQ